MFKFKKCNEYNVLCIKHFIALVEKLLARISCDERKKYMSEYFDKVLKKYYFQLMKIIVLNIEFC